MGSAEVQGELWGIAARDWTELQEPFHKPLWDEMLSAAQVGQDTRVLDAGCGGGGAAALASQRGAHVSGLDASEPLIRIASERVPGGDFRTGDIESMPFPDDSFDAVIAANSIQYAANRVAALEEMGRVCVPGGRVVAGLFSTPDKVGFRVFFKAVRDTLPEPPPGDGPFGLSAPGILEELFENAGLQVVHSGEVNCPFAYQDFDAFWKANVAGGPVQGALRVVGEEQLKTAVLNAVEPFQNKAGSINMDNYFRYVVANVR